MAVSVDATLGGAAANSYQTVADVTAHIDGRLNSSAWDSASADSKNRAAVEATSTMETFAWRGVRVDSTQALAWPRDYVPIRDPATVDSLTYYVTTAIPADILKAHAELALEFVKAGATDLAAADPKRNVKRKKVDVIETEYFGASDQLVGLQKFTRFMALIAHFTADEAGVTEVVRV